MNASEQNEQAQLFKSLHKPGEPVIIYNVWDPGSAQTVVNAGAKALATSSHAVANAYGYEDGGNIPLDLVIENAERVVKAVDVPVSVDFETGYGESLDELKNSISRLLQTGVIGINFEDQIFGQEAARPIAEQAERIRAVRQAAADAGIELFINARTDIFRFVAPENQDQALLDEALERAQAYKDTGGDCFFPPAIRKLEHIEYLCEHSPLPVNIIYFPSMPSPQELIAAGVSRISYGPNPYLQMVEWLSEQAKQALADQK